MAPSGISRLIYYEACREVVDAVERAEASVTAIGAAPRGSLRVTAPLGFGRRVLAPLMTQFQAAFPNIEVRLRLSDHMLDLLEEAVDAAIRLAVLKDSSLAMYKIADCRRVLCASPTYLQQHGVPQSPGDLLAHQCLLLRYPGSPQSHWTLRSPDGLRKLAVAGRLDADDSDVLTTWALAGEGIVLKPVFVVADHLRSGALVPVLRDFPPEPATLAVLHPYRQLVAANVRAFIDFVVDRARAALLKALDGLEP